MLFTDRWAFLSLPGDPVSIWKIPTGKELGEAAIGLAKGEGSKKDVEDRNRMLEYAASILERVITSPDRLDRVKKASFGKLSVEVIWKNHHPVGVKITGCQKFTEGYATVTKNELEILRKKHHFQKFSTEGNAKKPSAVCIFNDPPRGGLKQRARV